MFHKKTQKNHIEYTLTYLIRWIGEFIDRQHKGRCSTQDFHVLHPLFWHTEPTGDGQTYSPKLPTNLFVWHSHLICKNTTRTRKTAFSLSVSSQNQFVDNFVSFYNKHAIHFIGQISHPYFNQCVSIERWEKRSHKKTEWSRNNTNWRYFKFHSSSKVLTWNHFDIQTHLIFFYLFPNNCREWTEDGQLWIQYVSSTPATRLDVINLQEQLDHQLQARQARETGICPVREELYSQCFGE